jgi:hypothetical protein
MQTTDSDLSALPTSIFRRVFLLYGGLAIISFTFSYLGGGFRYSPLSLPWHFLGWIYSASLALVIDYGRRLCVPPKSSRAYRALFLAPALVQIGLNISRSIIYIGFDDASLGENLYFLMGALAVGLALVGVRLLQSAYIAHTTRLDISVADLESPIPSEDGASSVTNIPSHLLGQGDSYIDRVIKSVVGRSMKSEHVASISMIIMIVLVMVGGMASFGLWAFTHADRISSLEAERNKLISLQADMKEVRDKLTTGSEDAKAQLDRLIKFIDQNYSTSESFKETLNRLSVQSQTNYADIAIRVTIAVLTIFLVQVFFSVYKYNRHLAIMLAAKAEALELAGNDAAARKELSREAVSIVKESVPGFGPHPRTPIEEATSMAERFRKS